MPTFERFLPVATILGVSLVSIFATFYAIDTLPTTMVVPDNMLGGFDPEIVNLLTGGAAT